MLPVVGTSVGHLDIVSSDVQVDPTIGIAYHLSDIVPDIVCCDTHIDPMIGIVYHPSNSNHDPVLQVIEIDFENLQTEVVSCRIANFYSLDITIVDYIAQKHLFDPNYHSWDTFLHPDFE